MSTDPESRSGFGPYLEGVGPVFNDAGISRTIRYGNISDLNRALELYGKDVAGFLIEPIQGEAGYVKITCVALHTLTASVYQHRSSPGRLPCQGSGAVQQAQCPPHLR